MRKSHTNSLTHYLICSFQQDKKLRLLFQNHLASLHVIGDYSSLVSVHHLIVGTGSKCEVGLGNSQSSKEDQSDSMINNNK